MAIDQMQQLIDSMENSLKLQCQARAERRANEAERERREFQEKLMHAAVTKTELDSKLSKVKGNQDAVQRDQLIGMMMAGF